MLIKLRLNIRNNEAKENERNKIKKNQQNKILYKLQEKCQNNHEGIKRVLPRLFGDTVHHGQQTKKWKKEVKNK